MSTHMSNASRLPLLLDAENLDESRDLLLGDENEFCVTSHNTPKLRRVFKAAAIQMGSSKT